MITQSYLCLCNVVIYYIVAFLWQTFATDSGGENFNHDVSSSVLAGGKSHYREKKIKMLCVFYFLLLDFSWQKVIFLIEYMVCQCRYIHKAGSMGWCMSYPSRVKEQELRWAEKGPRRSGERRYETRTDMSRTRTTQIPRSTSNGAPPNITMSAIQSSWSIN